VSDAEIDIENCGENVGSTPARNLEEYKTKQPAASNVTLSTAAEEYPRHTVYKVSTHWDSRLRWTKRLMARRCRKDLVMGLS
jgi:hypothetical protein